MAIRRTPAQTGRVYPLGAIRLYREDLQAIAKAVAELGPLHIAIRSDGLVMDDPADFADLPEKIANVSIIARSKESESRIIVELFYDRAAVTVIEPDTLTSSICVRIQDICSKRTRVLGKPPSVIPKTGFLPSKSDVLTAAVFAGALAIPTWALVNWWGPTISNGPVSVGWLSALVGATALALGLVAAFLRTRIRGATLVNAYEADRPPFWRRHRSEAWLSTVGAVAGAVLGYFINQLL
ncbi:hypothetical protein [Nonomuraea rubra]|uniref:hypothetical protein n=1 Tax=Nonomuraea rubra TaxID=46180 RepID=UPI0033FB6813